MSVGEMCILIPNCGTVNNNNTNNNNNYSLVENYINLKRRKRGGVVPRCLFGVPDPIDTEKLFQEEMQREREKLLTRYGVDITKRNAIAARRLVLQIIANNPTTMTTTGHDVGFLKTEDIVNRKNSAITVYEGEGTEDRTDNDKKNEDEDRLRGDSGLVANNNLKNQATKSPQQQQQSSSAKKQHQRLLHSTKKQTHVTDFWRSRRRLVFDTPASKVNNTLDQQRTEKPLQCTTINQN